MSNMDGNFAFERSKGRENFSEWKVGLTKKGFHTVISVKLAESATVAQKEVDAKALAELTLLLLPSLYSYIEHAAETRAF